MILLYSGIIPIIKKAAVDAVEATQPVNITFGTVISASPLKIQVTPKLVLGKGNLMLAQRVTKHTLPIAISGETQSTDGHDHNYSISINNGPKVTVDNSLKRGDVVILARVQGGSTYLVLDKAVKS